MKALRHKINNVNLFIDLIALDINPQVISVPIYGLMVIGNNLFTYSACKFYCHLVR